MNWTEVREKIVSSSPSFSQEVGLSISSDPYDKATCCGTHFGNHITWKAVWLRCNPHKLAAWKRKKNREAKLRKKDDAMRRAN